jgi:hypothetical protein
MPTWSGNYNRTLNWKRKSNGNTACHQMRPAMPPCVLSAIALLLARKLALCGVGTGWRVFFAI